MQTISIITSKSQKAATSITCQPFHWLHSDSWTDQHRVFVAECALNRDLLDRVSWVSTGGRGQPPPLGTGFVTIANWILNESDNKPPIAVVKLQWELGTYERAWLFISDVNGLESRMLDESTHPFIWLFEFVLKRLHPDVLIVSGALPDFMRQEFATKTVLTPLIGASTVHRTVLTEITLDQWQNSRFSKSAGTDLAWIAKTNARENKELQSLTNQKPKPFLIRLLMSMNPVRRRRREKMIHPLTRLKYRL